MSLAWSLTPQGGNYWCNRYNDGELITAADIDYLKAVIAAYRSRAAELAPKEPTPAELKTKVSALEAEVAALKAKIASAKVVFPS